MRLLDLGLFLRGDAELTREELADWVERMGFPRPSVPEGREGELMRVERVLDKKPPA